MRIALVGPAHPYKGGVAQHTTQLAHRLASRGHEVALVSWYAQLPPHLQAERPLLVEPEIPPFPDTHHLLSWCRPDTWARTGSYLRAFADAVLVATFTPRQAPAYAVLAGRVRDAGVPVTGICHNVAPHEPGRGDRLLTRWMLSRVDEIIVHSDAEAALARQLTGRAARVAPLPAPLPFDPPAAAAARPVTSTLLFFGYVRPYKGLDVLVQALAATPEHVRLVIAGEVWNDVSAVRAHADACGVAHRVELRPGYVDAAAVPGLLASVDAMVLPYRHATGTWSAPLAHLHGLPVVATRIEPLASQVRDGVDGLLCEPGDPASLAAAITHLYQPGVLGALRAAVQRPDVDAEWDHYVDVVETCLPWVLV